MNLEDRLNLALRKNKLLGIRIELQPVVEETKSRSVVENEKVIIVQPTIKTYKTIKEGLKSAHKHRPDDFGTTIIVVEAIEKKIKLPMKIGEYIVDDVQRRTDGQYEVHLVND